MTQGARERLIDTSVIALAIGLAILAIVVHLPGHVSVDSSEQLYEAAIGRSVSWSPPFLSAVLRVLGGGTQATSVVVLFNAVLTYAGLMLAFIAARQGTKRPTGWPMRALLISLLVANPLVFLYVGIIWKDVVLATLLAGCTGLLLVASHQRGHSRAVFASIALTLLVPLLLVRQQGVILAIPLAVSAAAMLAGTRRGWSDWRWWCRSVLLVIAYAFVCVAVAHGTRTVIRGSGEKSTDVGFAAIQRYDLTAMLATGDAPPDGLPDSLAAPEFRDAVRRSYGPDRIDFVLNDPVVVQGFWGLQPDEVTQAFLAQVRARPAVFVQVKARQFAWLLGIHRLDSCLPMHVGVEGNPEYLAVARVAPGIDRYDHRLFEFGLWSRQLIFHRHWFYVVLLLMACTYLAVRGRRGDLPGASVAGALVLGLFAFYGAYAATTIACDFRYLYPGLVGTSILAIYLLAAGRSRLAPEQCKL